jgi:hypothetical protein
MASEVLDPAQWAQLSRLPGGAPCEGRPPSWGPPRFRPPPRSWVTSRLAVRPSAIGGLGLFAAEEIKAGGLCLLLGGQLVGPGDEGDCGDGEDRRPGSRVLVLDDGLQLVQDDDDPAQLVNHSCDPSLWVTSATTAVARRHLRPGDEATFDYALARADEGWTLECRCGSALCRGVVTGADWRLPSMQARYAGHFPPVIQRRIDTSGH